MLFLPIKTVLEIKETEYNFHDYVTPFSNLKTCLLSEPLVSPLLLLVARAIMPSLIHMEMYWKQIKMILMEFSMQEILTKASISYAILQKFLSCPFLSKGYCFN